MSLDEYAEICEKMAERWKVSPEIHPEDFIFQFLLNHPGFDSKSKAIEYYFNDGANSAQTLGKILIEICGFSDKPVTMLEFASGYGCVTRHFKNIIPLCSCTSCDIHPEAVQFIAEALKTHSILSQSNPDDLALPQMYEVIFALSFFSHMPKTTFGRWLRKLASYVKPGGFFIFTTHGIASLRLYFPDSEFDKDGFYFWANSEQKDLGSEEYGSAVVKPQYVLDRIFEVPDLTLKYFQAEYWWRHQDVYIVGRK